MHTEIFNDDMMPRICFKIRKPKRWRKCDKTLFIITKGKFVEVHHTILYTFGYV